MFSITHMLVSINHMCGINLRHLNTQHEHNEHLTLNMLRIILVNYFLVAMGFAKNRIVPYLIR